MTTMTTPPATLSTTDLLDLLSAVGDAAFATALSTYRNVEEAEDEAQRLISAALMLVQSGESIPHPKAWASTSVRNGLVDKIRKRSVERAHLLLEIESLMQHTHADEKDEVLWDLLIDEIGDLDNEERAVLFGIIAGIYSNVYEACRAQGKTSRSYPTLKRKIARALLTASIIPATPERVAFARFGKGSK